MWRVKIKSFNCAHLIVAALLAVVFNGCASWRGAIKPDLSESERKAQALELFSQGASLLYIDDQAALKRFDQAIELDRQLVAAYYNAGLAAELLGSLELASQRYQACLEVQRDQADCLHNLVLVKARLGQADEARQLVESYMMEFKDRLFPQVAAAKLAFATKNYARAEELALLVIEVDSKSVEALMLMAQIYLEQKRFDAAIWVSKNALEIAPAHGGLYLILGHAYLKKGQMRDALDSYELAYKYHPVPETLHSFALLLMQVGRVKEALPVLKRLQELRPSDYSTSLDLGNAYMSNQMFEEAKDSYLRAKELKPDDADINFNLGLLYLDHEPESLSELERLKSSRAYFASFVKMTDQSNSRRAEAQEYINLLATKIEFEEYAAQSQAKDQDEDDEDEQPDEYEDSETLDDGDEEGELFNSNDGQPGHFRRRLA